MRLTKMDLTNGLTQSLGLKRYLEICTPTTGRSYAKLDRTNLALHQRLMYLRNDDFQDGLPIDFSTSNRDISPLLKRMPTAKGYDIVFVDPYHEYGTSLRDLTVAFDLLPSGGVIVVHDCRPPFERVAAPTYIPGAWVGVTYKAYLDFVLQKQLPYCTVDADFGCGVIFKAGAKLPQETIDTLLPARETDSVTKTPSAQVLQEWCATGVDFKAAYAVFKAHQDALLRLIGASRFLERLSSRS